MPRLRLCFACLLFVTSLEPRFAFAAVSSSAGEKVLELPKLTVNDTAPLPELEPWQHTRITGFDVLSNASDGQTQKLLADFLKFQRAIQLAWPAPTKPLAASTLILCGRDKKFDAFVPANLRQGESPLPSLFLRNREQVAIVLDLEAQRVTINDAVTAMANNAAAVEYEIDHYRQLYREYLHYLLSQTEVRQPAWLEEGLVQIVMDNELSGRTLILGKIETYRGSAVGGSSLPGGAGDSPVEDTLSGQLTVTTVVGEQPFNMVLRNKSLLPFDRFFAVSVEDEEARQPLGNTLWAKQAYAFVHFCLFGEKQQYKESLVTYVNRLAREPASEKLFTECFHVSYAQMAKQLRGYILNTRHKYQKYELKDADLVTASSITLTPASPAQIAIFKGDALRLAGHADAALSEYRAAYLRGNRDPELLAGLAAVQTDAAMAEQFNNEAVRTNAKRPSAYITQARTRLAACKADPGPDGKLTPAQLSSVLTPLFKARTLPPPQPETYELIAEAWAVSSTPAEPKHLGVLDEGVRQFPRDSALIYRVAVLYQAAGAPATARAIAELGLRFATDPADKARLSELQNSLPVAAKPAPAGT